MELRIKQSYAWLSLASRLSTNLVICVFELRVLLVTKKLTLFYYEIYKVKDKSMQVFQNQEYFKL